MRWLSALRTVPLVIYPLIVYAALEYVDPKFLGVALLAVLLLRHRHQARGLARGLGHVAAVALGAMVIFAAAVWWRNEESLLRMYPVLLNLSGLALFGYTLRHPPSMIERFARLQHGPSIPVAVRYTRRVTWLWCGFFLLNSFIAGWTALFATREVWVLYNGVIAYGLMGVLFLGEWLVRRRFIDAEMAR
jgi:uncharacterized membrane protein